jgi:hypothetical protein
MPIIEVTCSPRMGDDVKRRLRDVLPHIVSEAVACDEEPYDGQLRAGDVSLLFRDTGSWDRFDLDLLVEVRTTWYASRAATSRRRAETIRDALVAAVGGAPAIGVYLILAIAAWAETG